MALTDNLCYLWAIFQGFQSVAAIRHGFSLAVSLPVAAQGLMDQWQTTMLPIMLTMMSDTWSLDALYMEDLSPAQLDDIPTTSAIGEAGFSVSDPLPAQIAVLIKWTTLRPGRSYRGRTYWPGMNVLAVQSGLVHPDVSAQCGVYVDAMLDAFTPRIVGPPLAQLGVISRTQNGVAVPLSLEPTVSGQVQTNFASVRARRTTA